MIKKTETAFYINLKSLRKFLIMRNFRKFKMQKKSAFPSIIRVNRPRRSRFWEWNSDRTPPGGGKGQNCILTLQHSFIYQSKMIHFSRKFLYSGRLCILKAFVNFYCWINWVIKETIKHMVVNWGSLKHPNQLSSTKTRNRWKHFS